MSVRSEDDFSVEDLEDAGLAPPVLQRASGHDQLSNTVRPQHSPDSEGNQQLLMAPTRAFAYLERTQQSPAADNEDGREKASNDTEGSSTLGDTLRTTSTAYRLGLVLEQQQSERQSAALHRRMTIAPAAGSRS